jgi:DNA modification methylase
MPSPIVGSRTQANRIYCADSRHLDMIEDQVVDLVICSPPYNVGGVDRQPRSRLVVATQAA